MTVSAVLNKRRAAASPETQARILKAVDELGYSPGLNTRRSPRQLLDTIGVVFAYCDWSSLASDRYFGPILDGIFDACQRLNQSAMIITEATWEQAYENTSRYFDGRCDGLIFMLPILPGDFLLSMQKKRHAPFVCVGESRPEPTLSVVDLDNVAAGYDATSHLLEAGHRRIAMFSGDGNFLSSVQREQGYRDAFADWGVEIDESLIFPGKYNTPTGYRRMRELLSNNKSNPATAVFCGDDWIAMGAMQAATELGLTVPDDMSIIGVNNNRESMTCSPPLTTVDHPLRLIGQRAVDGVMAQVRHGVAPGDKALIRGEIQVRSSVAPPKSTTR